MVSVSSHVLDSVIGTHASGIRVQCHRLLTNQPSQPVFNAVATEDGRISEKFNISDWGEKPEVELVFHSANYYRAFNLPDDGYQILEKVVVRIALPDPDGSYHLPIMLAPHSYSIWWSGKPIKDTV